MDIHYRLATLGDAEDIQHIKQSVWPDEVSNQNHIHATLSLANHTCYVAVAEHHVVGFLDCFATSNNNILRMEMDLLAVLPDYQGNGIASRLIRLCLYHPHTMKPALYRSLIQVNNIASQKSFQYNNFVLQPETFTLYIANVENQDAQFKRKGFSGTIIPVQTYNYKGHWIEAPFSKGNINIIEPGDIVGTVLPQDEALMKQAQQAGFSPAADYQWWILKSPLPPSNSQFAH